MAPKPTKSRGTHAARVVGFLELSDEQKDLLRENGVSATKLVVMKTREIGSKDFALVVNVACLP